MAAGGVAFQVAHVGEDIQAARAVAHVHGAEGMPKLYQGDLD